MEHETRIADGTYSLNRAIELAYEVCRAVAIRVDGSRSIFPELTPIKFHVFEEEQIVFEPYVLRNMSNLRYVSSLQGDPEARAINPLDLEYRRELNLFLLEIFQTATLYAGQLTILQQTFHLFASMERQFL